MPWVNIFEIFLTCWRAPVYFDEGVFICVTPADNSGMGSALMAVDTLMLNDCASLLRVCFDEVKGKVAQRQHVAASSYYHPALLTDQHTAPGTGFLSVFCSHPALLTLSLAFPVCPFLSSF